MEIKGVLPVWMTVLDGQKVIKTKEVVIKQQTAGEYYDAQANAKAGQWLEIFDIAGMTKLVDEHGQEHAITYDAMASTSRQNLEYLRGLRLELDAKERAESEDSTEPV